MANKRNPSDEYGEGIGHGKLYSPAFAIKVENNTHKQGQGHSGSISGWDSNLSSISRLSFLMNLKERMLEKLVPASVPPDALNKARDLMNTAFADINGDKLVDDDIAALSRIVKERLVDAAPNLSPDDIEKAHVYMKG